MAQVYTPWHMPKGLDILLRRYLLSHVHCCKFCFINFFHMVYFVIRIRGKVYGFTKLIGQATILIFPILQLTPFGLGLIYSPPTRSTKD